MDFVNLVKWLFEFSSPEFTPQIGFAKKNKKALLWVPSTKPWDPVKKSTARRATIRGCTQLAFEHPKEPMAGQTVEICWVGLDIDADDNPGVVLPEVMQDYCASMIRTSCSGEGVHVIYRLANPVKCRYEASNRFVKYITAPIVDAFDRGGIHVCKADRRMFWLDGGKNKTLSKSSIVIHPTVPEVLPLTTTNSGETGKISPTQPVVEMCEKLGVNTPRKSIPVYVGDMVELLRGLGETVKTCSPMTGNGQINGYLNIDSYSIELFAYADGHVIWSFTDVGGLINANFSR